MRGRAQSAAAVRAGQAPISLNEPFIDFGREICNDLPAAEQREWLVTNGIGGFASGTVAGVLTRRYHGLLVGALKPPLGRTLLVTKLDEFAVYDGHTYALGTNRWAGGAIDPEGYRLIERFRLEGTTPVWTFACAGALLEKRVWMEQGADTTYVEFKLARASRPLELTVKALVNYRDFHSTTHAGDWRMNVQPVDHGLRVDAFYGATPFYLLSAEASAEAAHDWHRNFDLPLERYRGLDDREDHLHAGTFGVKLQPGDSVTMVVSTEPAPSLDGRKGREANFARQHSLIDQWTKANPGTSREVPMSDFGTPKESIGLLNSEIGLEITRYRREAPAWIRQLVLAADQFIVSCPLPNDLKAGSVIAGYHWFGEWGRDTMIALPGLTLTTGRPEVARCILRTFSRFVDRGMLPNRFPDAGKAPEYNAVDATLWYFEAVRQYFAATNDEKLLGELFPVLADIVNHHVRGTRYNIHVDPADGLLYAGEPGVQLTWMDAKVGDWVVTPRIGKPVEVNALWYNALVTMAQFARALNKPAGEYESRAAQARAGFQRFWSESASRCFDVIDGPEGNDLSLRPNQLLAVSLPESPLTSEQQRGVVDVCEQHLLTPYGIRSLAPSDPRYQGHYGGGPRERDAAYHQGTVWGWLLGPFVLAHLRVHKDPARAASFLEPIEQHLKVRGLGTASEIFDGDGPFTPRGCIAQAWTVAEVLRAWTLTRAGKGA